MSSKLCGTAPMAICLAFLGAGAPSAVLAQAASSDKPDAVEEVVVTARFKSERLQDVGQSIQAFSGDELEKRGMTDFSDIVRRTPGLNFTYRGPNANTPSLRGMAQLTPVLDTLTAPQMTGIYYDDIPVTGPFTAQRDLPLYDLQRVEILRGPQGTLYGEGAMGGAIRYVTQDPSLDSFGGSAHASVSQIDSGGLGHAVDVSAGGPLVEGKLGLRMSAWDRRDEGFIDLVNLGEDNSNSYRTRGLRAVVLAEPTENLTLRLVGLHDDARVDGDWAVTGDPSDLENDFRDISARTDDVIDLVGLRVAYRTSIGTLQNTFGYYHRNYDRDGFDSSLASPLAPFLKAFSLPVNARLALLNDQKSYSDEARFVSELPGPFNFVLGGFYKDTDYSSHQVENFPSAALIYGQADLYDITFGHREKQKAVFGELYFTPITGVKITGGLRYIDLEVEDRLQASGAPLFFPAPLDTTYTSDFNAWLPKLAIEAKVTPDILLYASATKGARSGAQNSPVSIATLPPADQAAARAYDPDSVWAYETGVKSTLFNGRLTANLAAYLNRWDEAQLQLTTAAGYGYFENVGELDVKGIELELQAHLPHNLNLFGAFDWIDAKTKEPITLRTTPLVILPAGSPVPYVADFTASVGADWTVVIAEDTRLTAAVEYMYRDGSVSGLGAPGTVAETDALGLFNARLTLAKGPYALTLFGANLTNEIGTTALQGGGEAFINRPRTIGLSASYDF
jgi:outer membrane receptor protein involved in Fe transport